MYKITFRKTGSHSSHGTSRGFPAHGNEAKDDEQHHDWSMGFMHVLDLLTQPNPENCIEDYLDNWKAAQ